VSGSIVHITNSEFALIFIKDVGYTCFYRDFEWTLDKWQDLDGLEDLWWRVLRTGTQGKIHLQRNVDAQVSKRVWIFRVKEDEYERMCILDEIPYVFIW